MQLNYLQKLRNVVIKCSLFYLYTPPSIKFWDTTVVYDLSHETYNCSMSPAVDYSIIYTVVSKNLFTVHRKISKGTRHRW